MSYAFDLVRNTGRPSQLLPVLRQSLRAAGLDVHPVEERILVRHEVPGVGRAQARLELVPPGAGLLRLEVEVGAVPSPPPDGFYLTVADWNAQEQQLCAHTVERKGKVIVVVRASLVPCQIAHDEFPAGEIRAALERLIRARAELQGALGTS